MPVMVPLFCFFFIPYNLIVNIVFVTKYVVLWIVKTEIRFQKNRLVHDWSLFFFPRIFRFIENLLETSPTDSIYFSGRYQ